VYWQQTKINNKSTRRIKKMNTGRRVRSRQHIGGLFICLIAIFCLFAFTFTAFPKDITVIEDSDNDNGFLTEKAENNPDALRATSVQDMADKVTGSLAEGETIGTLTLIGHGSPGNISVGDGQGWESGKHIDGNRDEWEGPLGQLKDKFGENGRLVLIGCNVGSCDDGRNKLKELADFLGVPVEAPTGEVYGDCTEEEGSEHQVAEPGEPAPPHKDSPSDTDKKKTDVVSVTTPVSQLTEKQKYPFDVESISGIAIYPMKLKKEYAREDIQFDFTKKDVIKKFFSQIDFSPPLDGTSLGADYIASVFLKIGDQIVEYRIFCDYDYFLKKDDWKNMYDISWKLKQALRKMMKEKMKKAKVKKK
jgi:hypothetical protein